MCNHALCKRLSDTTSILKPLRIFSSFNFGKVLSSFSSLSEEVIKYIGHNLFEWERRQLSSLNIRCVYRPLIEPCMVAHFGTIFFAEPLIFLGDHCAPRGHLVTTIYTWGLHSPAGRRRNISTAGAEERKQ